MTLLNKLALAASLFIAGTAFADQNTNTTQTTLNYDATNARIGINTATPAAALDVSDTGGTAALVLRPATITPTSLVSGTIAVNSKGNICIVSSTAASFVKIVDNTSCTFSPAN